MRVNQDKAIYAVIGYHPMAGAGILYWHDEQLSAWRDRRELNREGGHCRVVSTDELSGYSKLINLLATHYGRRSLVAHWG